MTHQTNSEKLRALIEDNGLTKKRAAELIQKITIKPCHERTLRRWLADPDCKSGVKCPDWPIIALEKALKKPNAKIS